MKSIIYRKNKNGIIKFIFAGKLDNNKDRLVEFVEAIDKLGIRASRIMFDIYGPSISDIKKQFGKKYEILKRNSAHIRVHGLVSQDKVRKELLESDFSVFFRLNRRSANAGFPTKLGECMTLGIPVFCNNTGDISLVVKNRENGIMIDGITTDEIYDNLEFILNMSENELEQMKIQARKSAEGFFDFHNYLDVLNNVLKRAK